jgi:hypothetical protein
LAHCVPNLLRVERLVDDVERAEIDAGAARLFEHVGRRDDDGEHDVPASQLPKEGKAVHLRHQQVEDHAVGPLGLDRAQGFPSVRRFRDGAVERTKGQLEEPTVQFRVVDDEQLMHALIAPLSGPPTGSLDLLPSAGSASDLNDAGGARR